MPAFITYTNGAASNRHVSKVSFADRRYRRADSAIGAAGPVSGCPVADSPKLMRMSDVTAWEYVTVPLLTHATKQILDQWGADGWELVSVLPGPTGEQHVAYLKRPKG